MLSSSSNRSASVAPETGRSETLVFVGFAVFILGFYLLPSNRELGSTPHDLLFYLGLLPILVALAGQRMWRAVRRGDSGSRLLVLGLVFIFYLGLSALWTRGSPELSPWTVAVRTVVTAVFLIASSEILSRHRWRQFRCLVVVAAAVIAGGSIMAFLTGLHSYHGRLNSLIHFEHPNLFAHYTGFAALICLLRIFELKQSGLSRAAPWMGAFLVLVTGLVLTQGRTTMAAFFGAAGLAIVLARDRRAAVALALLVMMIALGFVLVGGDWAASLVKRGEAGRLVIYQSLIERMDGRWWFGVGLAAGDDVEFPVGSEDFPRGFTIPHSHSAFVATFYHGGALGLALLLALVGAAGVLAWLVARDRGDPTGAVLLFFGVVCLLPDGHRLVSNPHLSSWLIFWLPIAWIIAASRWQPVGTFSSEGEVESPRARDRSPEEEHLGENPTARSTHGETIAKVVPQPVRWSV